MDWDFDELMDTPSFVFVFVLIIFLVVLGLVFFMGAKDFAILLRYFLWIVFALIGALLMWSCGDIVTENGIAGVILFVVFVASGIFAYNIPKIDPIVVVYLTALPFGVYFIISIINLFRFFIDDVTANITYRKQEREKQKRLDNLHSLVSELLSEFLIATQKFVSKNSHVTDIFDYMFKDMFLKLMCNSDLLYFSTVDNEVDIELVKSRWRLCDVTEPSTVNVMLYLKDLNDLTKGVKATLLRIKNRGDKETFLSEFTKLEKHFLTLCESSRAFPKIFLKKSLRSNFKTFNFVGYYVFSPAFSDRHGCYSIYFRDYHKTIKNKMSFMQSKLQGTIFDNWKIHKWRYDDKSNRFELSYDIDKKPIPENVLRKICKESLKLSKLFNKWVYVVANKKENLSFLEKAEMLIEKAIDIKSALDESQKEFRGLQTRTDKHIFSQSETLKKYVKLVDDGFAKVEKNRQAVDLRIDRLSEQIEALNKTVAEQGNQINAMVQQSNQMFKIIDDQPAEHRTELLEPHQTFGKVMK